VYGVSWSQECVLHILIVGGSKKKGEEEEMAEPMLPLCLFCLEEIKENQGCPNLVGCGCEMNIHSQCLQAWFQQKQQMECPICHVVRVGNPIHRVEPPREYVIVHVQDNRNQEQIQRIRSQEKCVGFCCLTLIFWWIGGLILEFAF
jgi:hypothetical protein